jgi:hypothetical protein
MLMNADIKNRIKSAWFVKAIVPNNFFTLKIMVFSYVP